MMQAQLQTISSQNGTFLRVLEAASGKVRCPFHFHHEAELVLFTEGRGLFLIGDYMGDFKAGDLYLMGSDLPHFFRSDDKIPASALVFQFLVDPIIEMTSPFPEWEVLSGLLDRAQRGLVFHGSDCEDAQNIYLEENKSLRLVHFFNLLISLSDLPGRTLGSVVSAELSPRLKDERIARVCEYILSHYREALPHSRLAALACLSPSAFSRRFKRVTGLNSSQFITRVRLGHCARELRETDRSIAEIAFAVGFENLSNFNRRFQQHYTCSPRIYRNNALLWQ